MWLTLSSLSSVSFLVIAKIVLLWLQITWKQTAVLESFWRKSFEKEQWLAKGHVIHIKVQFSSAGQSCPTLWDCSTSGFPVHHQFLELTQTHVHQVGDAIQPSHPLSPPSPPVFIFPRIRVFSNEPVLCIRWPKYWSFSFSISPSNEYSGLISFRTEWFDLFAVHETLNKVQWRLILCVYPLFWGCSRQI